MQNSGITLRTYHRLKGINIFHLTVSCYLPLRITLLLSSPAEFLATHRNSPQSLSVMVSIVSTAVDIPSAKTLFLLNHVTLTGDKLLAMQLRLTFCPVLTRGGVVTKVILGRSAMATNQIKSLDQCSLNSDVADCHFVNFLFIRSPLNQLFNKSVSALKL